MAISSKLKNIEAKIRSGIRKSEEQADLYFREKGEGDKWKQFITKIVDAGAALPNPFQAAFKVLQKVDDVVLDKIIPKPDLDITDDTWSYGVAPEIEKGIKEGEKQISQTLLKNFGKDITAEFVSSKAGQKLGFGEEGDPYNIFDKIQEKFFSEKAVDPSKISLKESLKDSGIGLGQYQRMVEMAQEGYEDTDDFWDLGRTVSDVSSDFKYSEDFLKKQYEAYRKGDLDPEVEEWHDPEIAASYGWTAPEGGKPGYWNFKHGGQVPTLEDIYDLQGRKLSGSGNKSLNQLLGRKA